MNTLIKAMIDCGYEVRSYSGRSMYGKKCVGIVHDEPSNEVIFNIIVEVHNVTSENDYFEDIIFPLKSAKTDNMGMSTITYFPEMIWSDGVRDFVKNCEV